MSPAGNERGSVAEVARTNEPDDPVRVEHEEHPESFDPGIETGYLRRGARDHSLDPELGAAPFNPGPERFDSRRARRVARRREKVERKRRERGERARAERLRLQEEQRRARELKLKQAEENRRVRAKREHVAREPKTRERRRQEQAPPERTRRRPPARERAGHRQPSPRAEALARQKRARAARRRAGAGGRSTAPRLRPAGVPNTIGPTPSLRRQEPLSLRQPTVKAAVALAAVTATAFAAGALLGLPLPGLGDEAGKSSASLGGGPALALDSGTPIGLTKGPYFPVVLDAPADFGESAAKFHADRGGRKHEGQDVFAKRGTRLVAVRDGIVLDGNGGGNFYASGGGNTLVIYSAVDNRSYVYLHLLKPALVRASDEVKAGQVVGRVGCTGSCDGPHLHFEVRNGRADFGVETKAIDPLPLMRQWPQRPVD